MSLIAWDRTPKTVSCAFSMMPVLGPPSKVPVVVWIRVTPLLDISARTSMAAEPLRPAAGFAPSSRYLRAFGYTCRDNRRAGVSSVWSDDVAVGGTESAEQAARAKEPRTRASRLRAKVIGVRRGGAHRERVRARFNSLRDLSTLTKWCICTGHRHSRYPIPRTVLIASG